MIGGAEPPDLGFFLVSTPSTTDLFLPCCHAQILCGSSGAYLVQSVKKPWVKDSHLYGLGTSRITKAFMVQGLTGEMQ